MDKIYTYFAIISKKGERMKIVKRSKCGALWNGKGYLQIGLNRYDVKVVKNDNKKSENSPNWKLVLVEGLRERFLCSLFENKTKNEKTYLNGTLELGFGEMEIKIYLIDKDKRKDEKSPTSIMFGRLLMEDIDSKKEENVDVENIPEEEIPF